MQANSLDSKYRTAPVGMKVLFLLLIVASFAVFAIACGDDATPTPEPAATTAPEPVATEAPEPVATEAPEPAATEAPEPTATRAPDRVAIVTPEPSTPELASQDDALTLAFVQGAVEYYDANGLEATLTQYRSEAGIENGRPMTIIDAEENVLLVYSALPSLEGQSVGPGSTLSGLQWLTTVATEEGYWITTRGLNPVTKLVEPRRLYAVLHNGLIFAATHSALTEDVASSTKEYVDNAIAPSMKRTAWTPPSPITTARTA